MKRRDFIKKAGVAASVPLFVNGMSLSALAKPMLFQSMENDTDRVLVLVQLNGGNDGLNTLVPLDQYSNLYNARPNIILPESALLPFTDTLGLHPKMAGMKELYEEGYMGVIQSVGYPNPNRSHFRSMEIWNSASPSEEYWLTGWVGRYLDAQFEGFPEGYPDAENPHPFAISMGDFVSETCQGAAGNFSMTLNDPFTLGQMTDWGGDGPLLTTYDEELAFLRMTIGQTNAYADGIVAAANLGNNLANYPESKLAEQLKHVALLIAGGLKTRVFTVTLGGFDTHSSQVAGTGGNTVNGNHAALLDTLSSALFAFHQDLIQLGLDGRVITMTFSEFGRQIQSNASLGTDHGAAAPLIVLGACVNPQILGQNPEIPDQVASQEAVPMQYDFRDVYGSVLMDWFGIPEEDVKLLLYDGFQHLPIVNQCNPTNAREQGVQAPIEAYNYPNPFRDWTNIHFTCGNEWVRLSVFNALGSEIQVLTNQRLNAGVHEIRFDGSRLPAGNYYFRLVMGSRQQTFKMLKI